jgi:hypothetical protein
MTIKHKNNLQLSGNTLPVKYEKLVVRPHILIAATRSLVLKFVADQCCSNSNIISTVSTRVAMKRRDTGVHNERSNDNVLDTRNPRERGSCCSLDYSL